MVSRILLVVVMASASFAACGGGMEPEGGLGGGIPIDPPVERCVSWSPFGCGFCSPWKGGCETPDPPGEGAGVQRAEDGGVDGNE